MPYRFYTCIKIVFCSVWLGLSGCGKNSSKDVSAPKPSNSVVEIEKNAENIPTPAPYKTDAEIDLNSETIISTELDNYRTEDYAKFCASVDYPAEGDETLEGRNYYLSEMRHYKWRLKFVPTVYPTEIDYNDDGVEDFYLVAPGYNYSRFIEDYSDLYVVPGRLGKSESPEPDFVNKPLKRIIFSTMNRKTFKNRNPPNIETEGTYIITAKVTPVKFKNEIYLKIEAQLTVGSKNEYRSAYHNPPDWTTYAKMNHSLELQPICNAYSD